MSILKEAFCSVAGKCESWYRKRTAAPTISLSDPPPDKSKSDILLDEYYNYTGNDPDTLDRLTDEYLDALKEELDEIYGNKDIFPSPAEIVAGVIGLIRRFCEDCDDAEKPEQGLD